MTVSKRTEIVVFLCILALGAFFRFYELKSIPLGLYPDEAMNGNNALEALDSGNFKWFYPENNGREGLFINTQALSIYLFGNEPWALRGVSALFGTLAILGVYLAAKELFFRRKPYDSTMALLASFFIATSFWHINFSRIGFRAIMIPTVTAFALYFLLRGYRRGSMLNMAWAGVITGIGVHTYLAIRFFPFVLAVPVCGYLWNWWKGKTGKSCIPCLTALLTVAALVVVSPLILYFANHPEDFIGRTGQVAIFSAANPFWEFLKSNIGTLGMFFYKGDCNWRHNYNCAPALSLPLAILFTIGFFSALFKSIKNHAGDRIAYITILGWFFFMMFPATLTREGIPHALRSIGFIPPVMIMTALGAWQVWALVLAWFEMQKKKWPNYFGQLERIKKELALLGILLLLLVPYATFRTYFVYWAHNPNTYWAFSTDLWHLGQFLNDLPDDTKKYVVVNLPGTEVRGLPMPAQTVMFATNTFQEKNRRTRDIEYILPENIDQLSMVANKQTIVALLNGSDRELLKTLRRKFPQLKVKAPGDFIILEN